ncbi:MAG: hypothetical protein QNK03_06225 [Myxococcota bacterium]|nr:hypothetical protein [Myxococcota bacterium]
MARLVVLFGAQATLPHAHAVAAFETAIAGADAGYHATRAADHAKECLLCRIGARTRAFTPAPGVAVAPVATPRIPVVDAAVRAKRGPDLGAGPPPRAPPPLSPLV